MPTAARLTAAIAFAIVGYLIFEAMVPAFGTDTIPSYTLPLCILSGLWAGWVLCGKHANGIVSGIGTGLTAIVAQAFVILLVISFMHMLDQALRRRYDGPMDAVADVFSLIFDYIIKFGTSQMGATLLVGGLVSGLLAGIIGKKFPR